MYISIVRNLFFVGLFLMSSFPLFCQKLEPKKRTFDPDTTVFSKIMDRNYQLYMSFPRAYSTKDSIEYPVLYVLDGKYRFPIFTSARESMDFDNLLEDVIIVGVSSGLDFVSWGRNRNYDLTPSQDTIHDRKLEKDASVAYGLSYDSIRGTVQSGGAKKFLQCMTDEIIPFVEKHYKTTDDRGITGYSLGGLFTAWCLLNSDGVFKRYGINSPSFWWKNSDFLNQAEMWFNKNDTWDIPLTKVFISVGEQEPQVMISGIEKFKNLLVRKAHKNISLITHQFEGETHNSVGGPNLKRTIYVLYEKN